MGAGGGVVLLDTVTVLMKPYLQANSGPSRPTLEHLNLVPNDFLDPKVASTSKLDTLTPAGRRVLQSDG